jgi:thiamine kinase-like enzyme
MSDEVKALAAHVPALWGQELTVTPLGGGLTNRNYRVDAGGASHVLRIAGAGTEQLGIDREREVACSRAAAGAGIGPEVIAHLPEHRVTVTRFVQGKQFTAEEGRRPEVMCRLAQALRCCHDYSVPDSLGAFNPFAVIRNYHTQAGERNVLLPADLGQALDLLSSVEKELRTAEPPCLCHNDLLPANFIDVGTAIYIIDWEYGGLGNRFFDLGNFAVNHQLDEAQELLFLEGYFGEARSEQLRRLRLMRLVSDMREATWGFLQADVSSLESPAYYTDYGRKHLTRFLTAAEKLM